MGIFLIFIWILVDQQFIQMGRNKNFKESPKHLVIHSAPSVTSIDEKINRSASVMTPSESVVMGNTLHCLGSALDGQREGKILQRRRAVTPNPSIQKMYVLNTTIQNGSKR